MLKLFFLFISVSLFSGCAFSSNPIKPSKKSSYISDEYFEKLDFSKTDLLRVSIDGVWYYVRKNGKIMLVITNHKGEVDQFQEGLARTQVDGKIGFFDRNLDMVLEPFYDFAFPFHDGVAEICVGCREVSSGEYSVLDGGDWKRINRLGLILEE
jgi:hypothetical protein